MSNNLRSHGFTLIELLIVIAIIGLLVSLSIPAIQASREAARRTQCTSNQHQFGVAFDHYESVRRSFPPGVRLWGRGPLATVDLRAHSVFGEVLPYVEGGALEARYDHAANFFAPTNREAIKTPLSIAVCPSAPERLVAPLNKFVPSLLLTPSAQDSTGLTATALSILDERLSAEFEGAITDYSIALNADKNLARSLGYEVPDDSIRELPSIFPLPDTNVLLSRAATLMLTSKTVELGEGLRASQVSDGLSRTFLMTEVAGRPDYWERGVPKPHAPMPSAWADPMIAFKIREAEGGDHCLVNCDNDAKIYSFHPRGANYLFADGHVEFLEAGIEPRLLLALMTPDRRDNAVR